MPKIRRAKKYTAKEQIARSGKISIKKNKSGNLRVNSLSKPGVRNIPSIKHETLANIIADLKRERSTKPQNNNGMWGILWVLGAGFLGYRLGQTQCKYQ